MRGRQSSGVEQLKLSKKKRKIRTRQEKYKSTTDRQHKNRKRPKTLFFLDHIFNHFRRHDQKIRFPK